MDRKLVAEANVVVGDTVGNEDGVTVGLNEGTGVFKGDTVGLGLGYPPGFTHLVLGTHCREVDLVVELLQVNALLQHGFDPEQPGS